MSNVLAVLVKRPARWVQLRCFDPDWMGRERALEAARALAAGLGPHAHAVVEEFTQSGTVSLGIRFDNREGK